MDGLVTGLEGESFGLCKSTCNNNGVLVESARASQTRDEN